MTYTLKPIDDAFFQTAPIVIPAVLEFDAPVEQLWDALGSDAMWSWAPVIGQLVWTTGPPQTVGQLTSTMAMAPRGLPGAAALGRLSPVLARGNALAIGGIKKIL
jgi:hypothetical protein